MHPSDPRDPATAPPGAGPRRRRAATTPSAVARVPFDRVECPLLDAVLAMSFDAGELDNLLGDERAGGCACPGPRAAIDAAHRAAHVPDGAAARRLERVLDTLHARELEALDALGLDTATEVLVGRDLARVPRLAGWVWAVARRADPDADGLRSYLVRALFLDGFRALGAQASSRPTG